MSDPQPVPGRKTPRRAEPLQPDNPARGLGQPTDGAQGSAEAEDKVKDKAARDQAERSKTALENVREGYGK